MGYGCEFCSKVFAQQRYLNNHLRRCGENKPRAAGERKLHGCPHCPKKFPKPAELKRHVMHHLDVKNFVCSECDARFVQKAHLTRHQATVHSKQKREKNHRCPFCTKVFNTEWELSRHKDAVHAFADNKFKCRYCGSKFDNRRLYVNHLDFHNGVRNFVCRHCFLAFRRKTELENHVASKHGWGHFFMCLACGDRPEFSQRTQLTRHIAHVHPIFGFTTAFSCPFCPHLPLFLDNKQLLHHCKQEHFVKIFKKRHQVKQQTHAKVESDRLVMVKLNIKHLDQETTSSLKLDQSALPEDVIFDRELTIGQSFEIDLTPHSCTVGETVYFQLVSNRGLPRRGFCHEIDYSE